ncbi:zinc ribbon domain-containing protein [Clostridium sporogenes]|uniref:Zinc ribbon domain-containing protein n=2 Tax=Clostridium TaxID=1485 RepID=A0AAE6I480_CLOSG|nr:MULTISPECIES: zinc ribbon domain-containing protein [Clostridium]MBE6076696.1 zinc ribbon domain-containing protein [Clostridium lundense]MDU2833071.1 zinc ribbon domain-containing protein [Clostridium botulinum]KIS23145.1 membrane protein [Clostridium botulinum B2 450]MDU4548673.1 zinc ribbon domain-containing protein [Clostridium botulinum]MDU5012550.1 zinc ribbon domain-containing protein [Clostridium botulinum]
MFCSNCGNKLPEDAQFCTNCGSPVAGNKPTNFKDGKAKNEFTNFLNFFINSLKNPVNKFNESIKNMNLSITSLYFVILTLISGLITSFSIKKFISGFITFFSSFIDNALSFHERAALSTEIQAMISKMIPVSKLLFWYVLGIVLFYGLIMLTMYVIVTLIMKKQIKFESYLKVSLISLVIYSTFTVLAVIVAFLSSILSMFVYSLGHILVIVVLYNGFKNIMEDNSKTPYIFSFSYIVAMNLSYYFVFKSIVEYYLMAIKNNIF